MTDNFSTVDLGTYPNNVWHVIELKTVYNNDPALDLTTFKVDNVVVGTSNPWTHIWRQDNGFAYMPGGRIKFASSHPDGDTSFHGFYFDNVSFAISDSVTTNVLASYLTDFENPPTQVDGIRLSGNASSLTSLAITANTLAGATAGSSTGIAISASSLGGTVTVSGSDVSGYLAGVLVSPGNTAAITDNTGLQGNTVGIDLNGGIASVTGNALYANATGLRLTNTGTATAFSNNNFEGGASADNGTDLRLDATAGSLASPLTGNTFAGTSFYIDNLGTQSLTALSTFNTYRTTNAVESSNFEIENRIHHRVDTDLSITTGLVTWVTGNLYITAAGTDHSIQRGIDAATSGNTINVNKGTYAENLDITKPLTLLGYYSGVSAGKTPGVRLVANETILVPSYSDPDPSSPLSGPIVYVENSNTVIDGFTIDGNNPSLTSGVVVNGADVDAIQGVVSYEGVGSVAVRNNIIKNLTYSGVELYNFYNGGGASGSNVIIDNLIDNIGGGGYGWGLGVLLYNNNYSSVTGNKIDRVLVGLQTGNFSQANPGPAATISDNLITADRRGIFYNLHYTNASPFTISNNTISGTANGTDVWSGLFISSQETAVDVTISGNIIDGSASNATTKTGVLAWNLPTTAEISVQGGSISGVNYGVWVNNYEAYSSNAADTALTIDGVTITASLVGVYVLDSASNTNGAKVSATITGNTSIVTGTGTGILVKGSDASALITGNNASIHGNSIGIDVDGGTATITGNHIYDNGIGIRFANGGTGSVTSNNFAGNTDNFTDLLLSGSPNLAGTVTIGSGNSFAGDTYYIENRTAQDFTLTGTTFDLASNFRIEDRIFHKVDVLTSGLITWVTNNVYVTTPGGGSTDSSIQGGIDAVPNGSSGWTVNVEAGSYAEAVNVNEDVTLVGAGKATTLVTAPANSNNAVIKISSPGVTVDGFGLFIDQAGGVLIGVSGNGNNFSGLQILNNAISYAGASVNSTRGIALYESGPSFTSTVSIDNNSITSTLGKVWRGIDIEQVFGISVTDNTIGTTAVIDLRSAFAAASGTTLIQGNTFTGGGVEVNESNSGHTVSVDDNVFAPATVYRQSLHINHNYTGATVSVTNNDFTVPDLSVGILSGASNNLTVSGNTLTAAPLATSYALLMIDTQMRGNDGTQFGNMVANSITATGNVFNGSGTPGGVGAAIYNSNSTQVGTTTPANTVPAFGTLAFGGAGALANSFDASLAKFIQLNSVQNPIWGIGVTNPGGTPSAVGKDIDGTGNLFDLGSGLKLPSALTVAEKFALEVKLVHKPDNSALGLITTTPNAIYVPAGQAIQGGIDAVPLPGTGWTVIVESGTYTENPVVNKPITLLGANAGVAGGASRGSESLVVSNGAQTSVFTVSASGASIDGFKIDGDAIGVTTATTLSSGEDANVLYGVRASGALSNVTVQNNIITHAYIGFRGDGPAGGTAVSGSTINHNWFDSVGAFDFGYAVNLRTNFYADVTDNKMTRVHSGLDTNNFYLPGGPADWKFSGNTLSVYGNGIWQGQSYSASTPLTIDNNTITAISAANTVPGYAAFNGKTAGVMIVTLQDTVPLILTNNSISSTAYGVILYNTTSTGSVSIGSSNTITSNGVGIYITDVVGFNPKGTTVLGNGPNDPQGTAQVTLDGLTAASFSGNTTGVLVRGASTTIPFGATVAFTNSPILTGGSTGLILDGANAKVTGNALGTTTFNTQSGPYIVLSGGAYNGYAPGLDASAATFDTVLASGATLPQAFALEDKITHQLDDAAQGFVIFQANKAFVTQASGSIQRGVTAEGISVGGTVNVNSGNYTEDVLINTDGVQLLGQGATRPIIYGAKASNPANLTGSTIRIEASNVLVSGFDVTREGNNVTDWNDPGLNSAGLSIQGTSISGVTVSGNSFYGNRSGIDLNNVNGHTITGNRIDGNRTGIILRNPVTNTLITNNEITNNWTVGLLWVAGGLGESFSGSAAMNNNVSGNWYGQIQNRGTTVNPKNVSLNYLGTAFPTSVSTNTSEPGYSAQIPTIYGGTAVAPGNAQIIGGVTSSDLDFSPFYTTSTDSNAGLGFSGDLAFLGVTTDGSQIGSTGRIQEAINAVTAGGTVSILSGTYTEAVDANKLVTLRLYPSTAPVPTTVTTIQSLAGVSGAILDINSNTLNTGDLSSTFNGAFVGTAGSSIIKQGSGTWGLTVDNTAYTGSFAVEAGVVDLTGILGSGASITGTLTGTGGSILGTVTVNSGGLLAGTGSVNNANVLAGGTMTRTGTVVTSLMNAGTVSPAGIGTITAVSYMQTASGQLILDVNGPVVSRDQIVVTTGNVVLDGAVTINSAGTAISLFTNITIIDNQGSGTTTGSFTGLLSGSVIVAGANSFKIFYAGGTGNDVTLFTVPFAGPYTITYADDNWFGLPEGSLIPATGIIAANTAYVGYNAFAKIQPAINNTTSTGLINVFPGVYVADSIDLGANPKTVKLTSGAVVIVDGSLAGSASNSKVQLNKGSLTIGGSTDTEYAGLLSGLTNSIGFEKQGSGNLTIDQALTYTGPTSITGGTLTTTDDEQIPNASAVTINGGTLNLNGYWETIASLAGDSDAVVDFGVDGKLSTGSSSASTTFGGKFTGTGELVKQGSGTMVLTSKASNTSDFTGSTIVEAGTIQLGNGTLDGSLPGAIALAQGTTLAINSNSGLLEAPLEINNAISGAGRVAQSGTGVTRLTGSESFTGGIAISSGTLVAGTNAELSTGSISITGGSTLAFDKSIDITRTITADTTAAISVASTKTLTLNASKVVGGTFNGPGGVELTNATTLTGSIVGPSGSVTAKSNSVLKSVSNSGLVSIPTTETASLVAFGNLSGGTLTVDGTANTSGFTNNGQATVSGTLSNNGATSKLIFGGGSVTTVTPTGLVDVGSVGAYAAGALIRNEGNFAVTSTGTTTIDYGARFAAVTGSFDNNIATQNGGVYAPGSSPGNSNSSGFKVNGGGVYEFDLANAIGTPGALSGWDLVTVKPSPLAPGSASLDLSATNSSKYTLRIITRLNSGDYNTPGAMANFNKQLPYAWKFLDATEATTINGTFDAAAFNLDTAAIGNATDGVFKVEARDGGKNLYVVYTPNHPLIASVVINNGDIQRSRVLTMTLNFVSPVDASTLTGLGAITLVRTAKSSSNGTVGTLVQTGATGNNGLIIVSPATGLTSSVTLTFDNADGSDETSGVEYSSLADGYWQLSIPSSNYVSNLGDTNFRRLYGDINNDFTVNGSDLDVFGNVFSSNFEPFDYNADGTINGADLVVFGNRFSNTL